MRRTVNMPRPTKLDRPRLEAVTDILPIINACKTAIERLGERTAPETASPGMTTAVRNLRSPRSKGRRFDDFVLGFVVSRAGYLIEDHNSPRNYPAVVPHVATGRCDRSGVSRGAQAV